MIPYWAIYYILELSFLRNASIVRFFSIVSSSWRFPFSIKASIWASFPILMASQAFNNWLSSLIVRANYKISIIIKHSWGKSCSMEVPFDQTVEKHYLFPADTLSSYLISPSFRIKSLDWRSEVDWSWIVLSVKDWTNLSICWSWSRSILRSSWIQNKMNIYKTLWSVDYNNHSRMRVQILLCAGTHLMNIGWAFMVTANIF